MPAFSPRYDAALALAARAHRTQLRKGTDIPYIAHVVHVSVLLLRHGFDEDLVIAGLLHDVIEDCGLDAADIAAAFGDDVARLVVAVSEPPGDLAWEEAKAAKLAQLVAGGPRVAALKAADTLHNARSISADLRSEGSRVWRRFKRGAEPTLGYYRAVLAETQRWLGAHPLVDELAAAVSELEQYAGFIFHITLRSDWEAARETEHYAADTLATQGFIHCSTAEQLISVANAFFRGIAGLVLLRIAVERVESPIRFEPPINPATGQPESGSSERYPHIYGPLNLEAVVKTLDFQPQADGAFALPAELAK